MLDITMPCRRAEKRTPLREAFDRLVRSRGMNAGDFEIAEDISHELGDILGAAGRIVVVRRRSNGIERLYSSGPGSAWLGALVGDLDQGLFGQA
jgi:hypothetical protein